MGVLALLAALLPIRPARADEGGSRPAGGLARELLAAWRDAPASAEGLPADLAAFLRAARGLFDGDAGAAAEAFLAVTKVPASPLKALARVVLPDVLLDAGRLREAEGAAGEALRRFPALPWRDRLLQVRAAARAGLGDGAGDAAVPPRVAGARLEEARRAFEAGRWEPAIAAFRELRAAPGGASISREALLAEGRSLFRLGRMAEAHEAYIAAWRRHRSRPGLSWALKTAFMAGDHARGLELTREALATTGDLRATRPRLVEYLTTFGRYHEALGLHLAHLRELERGRRPPPRDLDDVWRLGWLLFRVGDLERALAAFEVCLDGLTRDEDRQRLTYWLARVRELRGDRRRAGEGYRAVAAGPDRYYRLLASSRSTAARFAGLLLLPGPLLVERFAGARLRGPRPDPALLAGEPLPWADALAAEDATLPDLPEVRAARFLLAHGHPGTARDYLRLLLNRAQALRRQGVRGVAGWPSTTTTDYRSPPLGRWGETLRAEAGPRLERAAWLADQRALGDLARAGRDLEPALVPLLARAGDVAMVRRHLAAWRSRQPAGVPGPPPTGAQVPLAYREHVLAAAGAESLDPFLLWAVALRESAFDERVVSPAGALGVFQVMPETGERLAALLEPGAGPFDPERLFEPATAVRFGARYLRLLLDRFRGQEPLAIAAYNAGPHYLAAWVGQKPRAPLDAFVEEIPFDENRAYVKRVLASWVQYREAHGFDGELFLGNEIDPRVEPGVSF